GAGQGGGDDGGRGHGGEQGEHGGHGEFAPVGQQVGVLAVAAGAGLVVGGGVGLHDQGERRDAGDEDAQRAADRRAGLRFRRGGGDGVGGSGGAGGAEHGGQLRVRHDGGGDAEVLAQHGRG